MARSIEFDRPRAVNRALILFWRKGYQATTLAELLQAMGISRSSFYAAFIDKRSLFIECLDLFAARSLAMLHGARATMPPVDALQHFFEHSFTGVQGTGTARGHWGCMLVNTVLEMAGVDDALAARASEHLGEVQRFFRTCLADAGARPDQAEALAAMLMLVMEGARVSSRRRLPDAQQRQPIGAAFELVRGALA